MIAWGRISLLVMLATLTAGGCGGRSGEGLYEDGAGGSGASSNLGAATSTGGRSGTAGSTAAGGPSRAGSASFGGAAAQGGSFSTGGGFPGAGRGSFGGSFTAGTSFGGGFSTGGFPSGDCCFPNAGRSCERPEIAKCVCSADPFCCNTQWDEACANQVRDLGCGSCGPRDCQSCVDMQCGMQLRACIEDFACLSIYLCMEQTGCEGFDCYNNRTCRSVIDQAGGLQGPAMNSLLQATFCAIQSGCPC